MRAARLGVLAACALGACAERPANESLAAVDQSIIYGTDDRIELFEAPKEVRDIAALSVAAMIPKRLLAIRDGADEVRLLAASLAESNGLCDGEPFAMQPAAAECTAVLIDDGLMLTAGHCVANEACADTTFVFDYYYRAQGSLERIERTDVYGCRRVIAQERGEIDFALVELDRPTYGRKPVEIGQLGGASTVCVVGATSGLPLKVELVVPVVNAPTGEARFMLSSDTFEGSSGSAVLDTHHKLVGVFSRGAADYVVTDAGCQVAVRRAEATGGSEQALHLVPVREALCAAGWSSKRLCSSESCAGDCPDAAALGDASSQDERDAGRVAEGGPNEDVKTDAKPSTGCMVHRSFAGRFSVGLAWLFSLGALGYRRVSARGRGRDSAP